MTGFLWPQCGGASIGTAESGVSSEFRTQQALHNDFVSKMFVSTHNFGQTTDRNKSRRTHRELNNSSCG